MPKRKTRSVNKDVYGHDDLPDERKKIYHSILDDYDKQGKVLRRGF